MGTARKALAWSAVCVASASWLPSGCGDETSEAPSCEGLEDTTSAQPVVWRFVNATDVPIYLPAELTCNAVHVGYQLTGPDGRRINAEDPPCEGSCEERVEATSACLTECLRSASYMLAPGAVFEHAWDGAVWTGEYRAPSCFADGGEATLSHPTNAPSDDGYIDCSRKAPAPAGTYTLKLEARTACQTDTGEACTCITEDPNLGCAVAGFEQVFSGPALAGAVDFNPSAGGVVEIRYAG